LAGGEHNSYFILGKGLLARKGTAHWWNCKKCDVASPYGVCIQNPEGTGSFDALEAADNVVWSDHAATRQ